MRCPFCGHTEDKVIDSRTSERGEVTRRRRECSSCERRFTTYERVEALVPEIIKKDGRREPFDREKLLAGVRLACKKRPVSSEAIEQLGTAIEGELADLGEKELASSVVGERLMSHLRSLDEVAYVRFASVYREFRTLSEFREALGSLSGDERGSR